MRGSCACMRMCIYVNVNAKCLCMSRWTNLRCGAIRDTYGCILSPRSQRPPHQWDFGVVHTCVQVVSGGVVVDAVVVDAVDRHLRQFLVTTFVMLVGLMGWSKIKG